jgi:FkbM family methyltransferase
MPCIQGFLTESLQRFRRTHVGYGFQDRWKIFVISLLQSVPNTFRKKSSSVDNKLERLAEQLSRSVMIRVNGVVYFVRNIEDLTVLNPDFEPFMKFWFHPRRGEVFVDIGAHVGKYTVIVAKAVGEDGTVVALEPHPITFKALQNNIALNKLKNVVALNVAAWNRTEELNFHLGGSASEFSAQGDPEKGLIKVQAKTMDELLIHELKLQRIDWMKIDVEKAEIESLQGMKATLAKFKPKLLIEVWNRNLDSVKNLLKKSNYDAVAISSSLGPSSEWCVYLFCASTIISSD